MDIYIRILYYLLHRNQNEGGNEVLTRRLTHTFTYRTHIHTHTRKHTHNITRFMKIREILWKTVYLRTNRKKNIVCEVLKSDTGIEVYKLFRK